MDAISRLRSGVVQPRLAALVLRHLTRGGVVSLRAASSARVATSAAKKDQPLAETTPHNFASLSSFAFGTSAPPTATPSQVIVDPAPVAAADEPVVNSNLASAVAKVWLSGFFASKSGVKPPSGPSRMKVAAIHALSIAKVSLIENFKRPIVH